MFSVLTHYVFLRFRTKPQKGLSEEFKRFRKKLSFSQGGKSETPCTPEYEWSTSGVPTEYEWSTSGVPAEYQRSTSGVPAEYEWSTSGVRWSTVGVPVKYGWSTEEYESRFSRLSIET